MSPDEVEDTVAELTRQRPGWLIWYSEHWARFWGIGYMLDCRNGSVEVTGLTPAELLQRIGLMEQLYPRHHAPWQEPIATLSSREPHHVPLTLV